MSARRPPQLQLSEIITTPDGGRARDAGPWAQEKLATISAYCSGFTTACKKARGGGVYIDAFCGPGHNRLRGTNGHLLGSPMIALRTVPPFHSLYFMDDHAANINALTARVGSDPRVHVRKGDANSDLLEFVEPVLRSRAPAFCLLDPHGIELRWSTVRQLARKRDGAKKCELLILFSDAMGFMRLLPTTGAVPDNVRFEMDAFFGSGAWQRVYESKVDGELTPSAARRAYADLYAEQLRGLGYKHVLPPREINDRGVEGKPLYQLFFATDDDGGERIMAHVFETMTPLRLQLPLALSF